jgi:hypothetical protein
VLVLLNKEIHLPTDHFRGLCEGGLDWFARATDHRRSARKKDGRVNVISLNSNNVSHDITLVDQSCLLNYFAVHINHHDLEYSQEH